MLQTRVIKPAATAYQYSSVDQTRCCPGPRYEKTARSSTADQLRYDYRHLQPAVARLANVLTAAGVKAGDTVAVIDWDSHRYLECMFAIPMIGAVVHTINVRLSPEQILYTMNHAEDRFVLVNSEFGAAVPGHRCGPADHGGEDPAADRWRGLRVVGETPLAMTRPPKIQSLPSAREYQVGRYAHDHGGLPNRA